jgi:hypothetical protein
MFHYLFIVINNFSGFNTWGRKERDYRMKTSKIVALFIVLVVVSYVHGEPILDQSQTNSDAGIRVHSTRSLCQTFTAGMSGKLTRVDLYLTDYQSESYLYDQEFPATISILGTVGTNNVPNEGNVLWTTNFASLAKGWFRVNTSVRAPILKSGVTYGIRFECEDAEIGTPDDLWEVQRTDNVYPNGRLWEKRTGGWVIFTMTSVEYPDADAAFKTYITVVPNPGTVITLR